MDKDRYRRLREPPPTALKAIGGGRLKGMTDINPQWRYRAMNDEYGPCGEGWKFTIDKLWFEPSGVQVVAFAMVSVYVRSGDGWSEAIPGIGGSMFVEQETKGLHTSDECYKMAVTDALGTAMKMLGVAAAIYEGRWDGSKYKPDMSDPPKPKGAAPTPPPPAPAADKPATPSLLEDCKARMASKTEAMSVLVAMDRMAEQPQRFGAIMREMAGFAASKIVDLKPPANEHAAIRVTLEKWEASGWIDKGYAAKIVRDMG